MTLDAVNDCKVLRLSEPNVRRAFEEDPDLAFLVDCLVSKDITRKLYVINDNVYSASKRARSNYCNSKRGEKRLKMVCDISGTAKQVAPGAARRRACRGLWTCAGQTRTTPSTRVARSDTKTF